MKETAEPKLYRFSLALECFLNWTPLKAVPFFRKSVIRSVEDAEEFFGTCASIVAKKPS